MEPTSLDPLLGGALLTDLALAGAVQAGKKEGLLHQRKVHAAESVPALSDPLLAQALATVAAKERSAEDLVSQLGKAARADLLSRLEERGMIRREPHKALGLFPYTRWPATDDTHEVEVRAQLQAALIGGVEPDTRTAALIALLHAVGRAHNIVDTEGRPDRDVRKRAETIAEGEWAATAVRDAVQATQAAVMAAVMAATAASAISSGR